MTALPPRGGGEVVADKPRRYAEIKLGVEELCLVEFRHSPGERGPDPHIHHTHTDGFLVLEGEWTFELGPDRELVTGGPGTLVLIPPGLVHTFRNESAADARCINIHAPGAEFHRYLRGQDVDFDQHPPPDGGGLPVTELVLARDANASRREVAVTVVDAEVPPRTGWTYPLGDGRAVHFAAPADSLDE